MAIRTRFVIDDAAARRALRDFPKQARFAAALALTRVAQEAQARVRGGLPEDFTVRSPWVGKGIRIVAANRRTLEAAVFSKDDFMALQETGGTKAPRSGNKTVAVPIGARSRPRTVTRPGVWPKALLDKPGHFIAPLSAQRPGGSVGVWKRFGAKAVMRRGRYKGKRRQPLALMHVLKDRVEVEPRFRFRETVEQVARERFSPHFQQALREALATAKP